MSSNTAPYYSVAQITDPHVGRTIAFPPPYGEVELLAQFRQAVDTLNRFDPLPDLVVVTGDLANHGREEDYRHVRLELGRLCIPYRIVVGNHDRRSVMAAIFSDHAYLKESGEFIQYTVEEGPLRLVMLDSLEVGTHYGQLCDRRLAWLEQTLSARPDRPTLIFMHHPPFVTGMPYPDHLGLKDNRGLAAVIARHPQVEAIASGHTHREAMLRWQGTVACTTPSCTFSYKLEFQEVSDLDPLLEPPAGRIFRWHPETGLVSHLFFIGDYPFGITEGVPAAPAEQ